MNNEEQLAPCKYCGRMPNIVKFEENLYYAQCSCNRWSPYEFLGFCYKSAVRVWNIYNKSGQLKQKREIKR